MEARTKERIENALQGFTGTEAYHRLSPMHGGLVATDGVLFLAKACKAFWLIDAIASYQKWCMEDEMLQAHQFWSLYVNQDGAASLTCERDLGDEAIRQEISYTDFPLTSVKVWVEPAGDGIYVAMLPSEH